MWPSFSKLKTLYRAALPNIPGIWGNLPPEIQAEIHSHMDCITEYTTCNDRSSLQERLDCIREKYEHFRTLNADAASIWIPIDEDIPLWEQYLVRCKEYKGTLQVQSRLVMLLERLQSLREYTDSQHFHETHREPYITEVNQENDIDLYHFRFSDLYIRIENHFVDMLNVMMDFKCRHFSQEEYDLNNNPDRIIFVFENSHEITTAYQSSDTFDAAKFLYNYPSIIDNTWRVTEENVKRPFYENDRTDIEMIWEGDSTDNTIEVELGVIFRPLQPYI